MACIKEIKSDYYVREKDDLSDFSIDQTIVLKEKFLKSVSESYSSDAQHESTLDEWYPYVNAYYPYTEDVDAFARVSHLLATKPSFVSLTSTESQSNFQENFPYSERSAQLEYLESEPVSFIILGKPGIGEEDLGKQLAEYWNCVYINPEILIEQEIDSGSRAGQCIEFNLRCGRAVGIDVILRLVEKRVKSETAKHRGFVICGLPLIPNDLYEEDPISSESAVFTVKEIFEELFEATIEIGVPPSKPRVSISSKYKSDDEELEDEELKEDDAEEKGEGEEAEEVPPPLEELLVPQEPEIPIDVGPDFDICDPPDISTNYENQLNYLFELIKSPFVIIYIMCSTPDVIDKRDSYRFDVYSGQSINLQTEHCNKLLFNYFSRQEGVDVEEIPEELFETSYIGVDSSSFQHLLRLPRHFPANVSTQMDSFHYTGLRFIEQRILMQDPQYFLKVDGRANIQRMFHIIKSRLSILPLQKVLVPAKLNVPEEALDIGEGAEPQEINVEGLSLEECYIQFCKRQVPSIIFKWRWSDWGTRCPVAMRDGVYRNGDPNFAVRFMNKMFFLTDEEAFIRFYRNPRPYLLPPFPKPSTRVFIFGPKYSGRSEVAACLGYYLNSTVASLAEMLEHYIGQEEEELKNRIRQAAIVEAIQILNETRTKEAAVLEEQRAEKIKEWLTEVVDLSEQLLVLLREAGHFSDQVETTLELSSFRMAMRKVSIKETVESETIVAIYNLKEKLELLEVPYESNIEHWENLLKEKIKFLYYLPAELRTRVDPIPATIFDEFVIEYAENAVANADLTLPELNTKNLVDVVKENVKSIEESHMEEGNTKSGWIVDGMLCNPALMQELYYDCMADEIIVLRDEPDFEFLINKFKSTCKSQNRFREYRSFFMHIGRPDAAWRCPSIISTKSYKTRYVQDLLHDILDDENVFYDEDAIDKETELETNAESFRQELFKFEDKYQEVKQFLVENGIAALEIKVTDRSLPELMEDVIKALEDKYKVGASIFTEEDRAEEIKDILSLFVQKDVGEGGGASNTGEDLLEKHRRFGDTYHYCPVTFHDKWVLWKGKEDFAVKFKNTVYLLNGEEDMNKFIRTPRMYLPGTPVGKFPPPRICVIGIPGLGKTSISKMISENFGLAYVSFESVLKKAFDVNASRSLDELLRDEETEETLYKYLNSMEPMPEEILEQLVCKLWFDYPIKAYGFVLDDFPKRPSDIEFMVKYKLIPDMIIHLTGVEGLTKDKLIEDRLNIWEIEQNEKRMMLEEENKQAIEEWENKRKKRFEELMEEKREQRYAEKKKGKAETPAVSPRDEEIGFRTDSQVSFDSVAEQEDLDQVNRILETEYPELILDDSLETLEEATERFDALITDIMAVESEALRSIRSLCTPELIPFTDVICDFDYYELTNRKIFILIDPFKYRTKSHFERCYDVSMEVAERLLTCGYFFLSRFGKTCPVQYYENKNPIQMFIPMEQLYNVYPIVHRSFLYFVVGPECQEKFKENPMKYVDVEKVNFPLISLKVAVTGPPKSGKTILAQRIRNEWGFKYTTRGQAARYVLMYLPLSNLAKNMESVLRKGWELTDEMVAKCVEAACLDSRATTQARRVPVPDERFDFLCDYFKPISKVPSFLTVVDIAGLVKGASEGQGLGNAFLSHISACDAIFHLCRAFEDDDVTHVEGEVNPVRDLDIICEELRLKDEETLMKNIEKLERVVGRGADKKLKPEYDTLMKIKQILVDEKKHIRFADWDGKDVALKSVKYRNVKGNYKTIVSDQDPSAYNIEVGIEFLNKYLFLTSKPAIYLVNLSEKDYIKKKNKWLIKIKEWVDKNDPGALIIPFSGVFEHKLAEEYEDPELRKKFLEDNNTTSALDKIIVQGYKALQLEYFFTAGPDEVKAWNIQKGTKAPQAAGRIHTDFEKGFIMAEVMKFSDFKEEGSEASCKAAGKYRQQGRNYVVEDGDIIFFKFNAGAGLQQPKKK